MASKTWLFEVGDEIGPYKVVRRLGYGGFGQAYQVRWTAHHGIPEDCVKIPHDQNLPFDDLMQEIENWAKVCTHENISSYHRTRKVQTAKHGELITILSDLADYSLRDWLKKNSKAPTVDWAVQIIIGILRGLEFAHRLRIIHRDIKPENILLKQGKPLINDFGLARDTTIVGDLNYQVLGTGLYMPPESFQRGSKRTPQYDLWAVGVTFYELLAGERPFESIAEILVGKEPPLPNTIPLKIRQFIEKSLMKNPGDRFESATEMLKELEPGDLPKTFKNSIGMKFILIPKGQFMQGSPENEKDRFDDETQHLVTISKDFYMGKYLVTQEEYEKVMKENPSHFKNCPRCPIENVSWEDAQEFIKRLNAKNDGYKYRLPTEAEWEYACRAGTKTRFYWGDDLEEKQIGRYAWYDENADYETHEVGLKLPNAFELYDMSGNVREWCDDWYAEYPSRSTTNKNSVMTGLYRIVRGGSWIDLGYSARCAYRHYYEPSAFFNDLGFRLISE